MRVDHALQRFFQLLFFSILVIFSPLTWGADSKPVEIKSYFSPNGGAHDAIVRDIQKAQRTIDIAMYNFSSGRILKALKQAHARGVQIRMIFNDGGNRIPDEEGEKTKAQWSSDYEDAGIDVRYVEKIMHEKFMIVDGFPEGIDEKSEFSDTILVNASGNFSDSADSRYNENWIELKFDASTITQFQKEFHLLWSFSYDFPNGTLFKTHPNYSIDRKLEPSLNIVPYFTSQNFQEEVNFKNKKDLRVVSEALEKAILNAKKSIYVATGHFRLMALANALLDAYQKAKKEGRMLDVRVISDSQEYVAQAKHENMMRIYDACQKRWGVRSPRCELAGGYQLTRYLFENEIGMRLKYTSYLWHYPYEPQMHHKYMIIDGKEVCSGSYNWSRNAEFNTFETLVHFKGSEMQGLAESFTDDFLRLWELHRNRYDSHLQSLKKIDRIPIHFGGGDGEAVGQRAMGLSIQEIDGLLKILEQEAPQFFRKAKPEHKFWNKSKEEGE